MNYPQDFEIYCRDLETGGLSEDNCECDIRPSKRRNVTDSEEEWTENYNTTTLEDYLNVSDVTIELGDGQNITEGMICFLIIFLI